MGEQRVSQVKTGSEMQKFVRQLLNDVQSLEYMLDQEWFEDDIVRIGAEQEMCLVDKATCKPAPIAMEVLAQMPDAPWAETELAKFNLETNLTPKTFVGDCLRQVEEEILDYQRQISAVLDPFNAAIVLTGVLPTLRKFDLELHNLTPKPRYFALIESIKAQLSKSAFELAMEGIDELKIFHNSPLLEACNTSFQVHLQVSPQNFVQYYNIAQVLAAPVMAIAANSPLVFGRRLWHESRIALFQQALDTRKSLDHMRESSPRVHFGKDWLRKSVAEIHKDDIARFRVLLAGNIEEDSVALIRAGKVPKLRALQVFNSTVYRWNRPCYGISPNGKPHLRIENRVIAAGPTVIDEVANAAFWLGSMIGAAHNVKDITSKMSYEDAMDNFMKAARYGIDSKFTWSNDNKVNACDLILKELLPIARQGLEIQKVNPEDIDRYLGVIEARAQKHMNGARWQLRSFSQLKKQVSRDEAVSIITASMINNQKKEIPVHNWPSPEESNLFDYQPAKLRVSEFMQTNLFTVQKDDVIELVAKLMDWRDIRFMPVENNNGKLIGLIATRDIIRYYAQMKDPISAEEQITAKDIMTPNPITISPEATISEALRLMKGNEIGCLPVVKEGELVGLITEGDFLRVSSRLIERFSN